MPTGKPLTEQEVALIRARHSKGDKPDEIARDLGVATTTIKSRLHPSRRNNNRGKTWKPITLSVPLETFEAIGREAARQGIPRTQLILDSVAEHFKRNKIPLKPKPTESKGWNLDGLDGS